MLASMIVDELSEDILNLVALTNLSEIFYVSAFEWLSLLCSTASRVLYRFISKLREHN